MKNHKYLNLNKEYKGQNTGGKYFRIDNNQASFGRLFEVKDQYTTRQLCQLLGIAVKINEISQLYPSHWYLMTSDLW
jgi:hypothetical protein